MRVLLICVVVCLAARLSAADEKEKWIKVAPDGGGFEILFPSEPKKSALKDDDGAQLTVTLGNKGAFNILYSKLDVDIKDKDEVKERLDACRDGAVKQVKGKLVTEKNVLFAGKYPARDIEVAGPKPLVGRVRIILTGTMLYAVMVAGTTNEFLDSKEAKMFVDSFKVK
jgi:hypothetical protein